MNLQTRALHSDWWCDKLSQRVARVGSKKGTLDGAPEIDQIAETPKGAMTYCPLVLLPDSAPFCGPPIGPRKPPPLEALFS